MFKGSYVALVTPMFASGQIDTKSLQKLVEFHIENKTHGIVAVGTTGESATLPFEEHIDVVRLIVKLADGKLKVIAGSGANSTEEAVFLSKQMANTGIDGYLSVVPYYNKPQQRGIVAHFNAIADATDLPVLLYNVPGRTVADMLPEAVAELAKHPNIVGIKDATGDLKRLSDTKKLVGNDFLFLSGDDETSCEFLCAGGDGVISVTANVAPLEISQMCDAALAGDFVRAKSINDKIHCLHTSLFLEPNPVIPKWVLYKMGLIENAFLRLPMVMPELNSKNNIELVMKNTGLLN